jgi:Ca2+-binding EF-hand superfamily protein
MDLNGDGTIDLEEMRTALMKIGLPCSPHYVEQMFQQYNRGKEGGVIT